MTYQQIYEALLQTGLPVTYEFWESPNQIPPLPYIVFTYPQNDDYGADNTNYAEIVQLEIGLYTKRKDPETERLVEAVLKQHFTKWLKNSVYVRADAVQETIYQMEVAING